MMNVNPDKSFKANPKSKVSHKMSSTFYETINIAKQHGINLIPDVPNEAKGNCLFDSIISNINHRSGFIQIMNEGADFSSKLKTNIEYYWKLTHDKTYSEIDSHLFRFHTTIEIKV